MDKAFIDEMKQLLEEERTILSKELQTISSDDSGDHVPGARAAKFPDYGDDALDSASESPTEVSDFEVNTNITGRLEERMRQVEAALDRIVSGTYGICVKTGKPITEERLRANPAADTTIDAAKSHT